MRYICAQPANDYYTWQVEVLINNFIKHGVNPNSIDILCAIENNNIPSVWQSLKTKYDAVNFFFYDDTRIDRIYQPSIYFNLMASHFKANPELKNERFFMHDSDIVFTKQPQLGWVPHNDDVWYLSDTNSYINYSYIQQKGNDIYEEMCDIIGIDKLIPKLMNSNSGGAQYITIGTDFAFWKKVEDDSIKLYRHFCEVEPKYIQKHENDYPIQKWTAGMWSLLWNAWRNGHETKVDKRLDFGWVTDNISSVDKHFILHNAGVTAQDKHLFFKGSYTNRVPYNQNLDIDKTKASSYYWAQIQEAAKVSDLI